MGKKPVVCKQILRIGRYVVLKMWPFTDAWMHQDGLSAVHDPSIGTVVCRRFITARVQQEQEQRAIATHLKSPEFNDFLVQTFESNEDIPRLP